MAVSIAIDGPAGAGKSTIAKLLAAKMNYIYVDTGAMYRAMAVYFTQNHVNPDDEREINAAVSNVDITIEYMDGVQQVILNGDNVTGLLRTEETGKMASKTSKYAAVRKDNRCHYGRQGHWNDRASGCFCKNLSDSEYTGTRKKKI